MAHVATPAFNSAAASEVGVPEAVGGGRQLRVEMTRSQTPAKPALSNRNIEICQWVMPGNDVLISSVESGLAEASRPR
jgi:hypothetical protein